ncbi:hypothetical protein TNCV_2534261 [Trichonephila clavipes]|nr:hypothetical protein TNCV_2534261 [Trichonephila clavipes]
MIAVSVLEHFSDHDSIHQKMKKNTTSVRSYPNSAGDDSTDLACFGSSADCVLVGRGSLVDKVTAHRDGIRTRNPDSTYTTPAILTIHVKYVENSSVLPLV